MKLITLNWNIGGGRIRKINDEPTDTYAYSHKDLDYIITKISSYNADIITLQETHTTQTEIIAKKLNLDYFVNATFSKSHLEKGQYLRSAILSKYPLLTTQVELFDNPGYQAIGPRGENWNRPHDKGIIKSVVKIKNMHLLIETLHLFPFHRFNIDPYGETAKAVRADILQKIDTKSSKFILLGDFNIVEQTISNFLPKLVQNHSKEVLLETPTSPKEDGMIMLSIGELHILVQQSVPMSLLTIIQFVQNLIFKHD